MSKALKYGYKGISCIRIIRHAIQLIAITSNKANLELFDMADRSFVN